MNDPFDEPLASNANQVPADGEHPQGFQEDEALWASILESEPEWAPEEAPKELSYEYESHVTGMTSESASDFVMEPLSDRPWLARRPPKVRHVEGVATSESLQGRIRSGVRTLLASTQGQTAQVLARTVADVRGSTDLLAALEDDDRLTIIGVLEVLDLLAGSIAAHSESRVDMRDTSVFAPAYAPTVREELNAVRRTALAGDGSHLNGAASSWAALVEEAQRTAFRLGLLTALDALQAKAPAETLAELHATLPRPTRASVTVTGRPEAMTASEWDVELDREAASTPTRVFSSGYRTLDIALTNPASGDPLGSFKQGTLTVIAAGSGEGKSSVAAVIGPAMARDLRNQGLIQARGILAHTEESPLVKIAQMGLRRGMRNADLGDNLVVAPVMSDRKMLARIIYGEFARSIKMSQQSGLPPAVFAPQFLILDYIQQLKDVGEDETKAVARSADFLLNGVGNANPDEMAKYSGEEFTAVTGMRWSDDLEGHRLAVVTFAQLIKFDESTLRYVPGSRNTPLEKFCVMDDAGNSCWDVQPGDRRIPDKSEIRGSGVLTQHATNIIMLSRSRVEDNPVIRDSSGKSRLMDTRARMILSKTRDGASMPYLPMAFDSAPSGLKGQYYDLLAEKAVEKGVFTPDEAWTGPGDPVLPRRASADPFAGVRY